jgi:hypothetical protein
MTSNPDWMSLNGAEWLAARIVAYWLERGHKVQATVVPDGAIGDTPIWVVRTDLVNGMPR